MASFRLISSCLLVCFPRSYIAGEDRAEGSNNRRGNTYSAMHKGLKRCEDRFGRGLQLVGELEAWMKDDGTN
ncbi:hypothetical protein F5B22DRAFT_627112 [Xylaria bambusicola]|uniref:uncharacterized protein n=1 Tax=Xylaria bambusicola TaxID=326684 RepID=UPI0020075D4F|nr:uncharacterized protein F5B22DRAFT_627112 [Xylaria bambusicola]KAI0505606.1 hypothetical protein F5B22DRAFT_627112 [Xylaria bambusicola]